MRFFHLVKSTEMISNYPGIFLFAMNIFLNDTLKGYVITLQNFDKLITEGVKNGSILVTENTIETKNTFDI